MGSKTDSIVKLGIFFFITLLSFSVGTFVGKKYSDNQHQLAAMEPQKNGHDSEREVASVEGHNDEHKDAMMSDEEISKLAEEFVADETPAKEEGDANEHSHSADNPEHGDGHSVKKEETHHDHTAGDVKAPVKHESINKGKPAAKHEEPSMAALAISENKAPKSHDAGHEKSAGHGERIPSSLPKDIAKYTVGKFTVQVASYADEEEAKKLSSALQEKGYSAFYVPANIKGKVWYRVGIGQFATQKEAQSYRAEFMNESKVTTAIVQKLTE